MNFRVYEIEEPTDFYCHSSKEVFDYLGQYSRADREIFLVLLFNAKNRLIEAVPVSMGTVDCSAVYPREVIRECIRTRACSVIFAHNHPTGDPEPSQADNDITMRLVACCELMDINVLDHVIIGQGRYYSYSDNGKIDDYKQKAKEAAALVAKVV